MDRINLGGGRWFDRMAASKFDESTRWDGSNHISVATGSQWDHEALYLTASGTWILHRWSQWQGSTDSYEVVSVEAATMWLIDQGHDAPAEAMAAGEL